MNERKSHLRNQLIEGVKHPSTAVKTASLVATPFILSGCNVLSDTNILGIVESPVKTAICIGIGIPIAIVLLGIIPSRNARIGRGDRLR
jgi:hypothetical protein